MPDTTTPISAISALRGLVVESVECFVLPLPALRDFVIAGGVVTRRGGTHPRVLVRIGAGGAVGWGEATPAPTWTYETVESIVSTIERHLGPPLLNLPVWDIAGAHRVFDRAINPGYTTGAPLAKAALDLALHDLVGRVLGLSVGELWGQRQTGRVPLAWIVSGDPPSAADEVAEGLDAGYAAFKIKVGTAGTATLDEDVRRVEAVRSAAPMASLWVDANQAYTMNQALRLSRALQPCDVALLEQPLRANDPLGLRRLRERSEIPVALDESLVHPSDLAAFVQLQALDIAVAKVQRTSGLHLSRRLCALAQDCGIGLVGSGLTDSALGLAASLHLFAAFGMDRPADLNGPQFVRSTYVAGPGVEVREGVATVPTGPGLGVEVDEEAVRGQAVDPFDGLRRRRTTGAGRREAHSPPAAAPERTGAAATADASPAAGPGAPAAGGSSASAAGGSSASATASLAAPAPAPGPGPGPRPRPAPASASVPASLAGPPMAGGPTMPGPASLAAPAPAPVSLAAPAPAPVSLAVPAPAPVSLAVPAAGGPGAPVAGSLSAGTAESPALAPPGPGSPAGAATARAASAASVEPAPPRPFGHHPVPHDPRRPEPCP
ncbi:mandelate racemase/muconate lactonizing enzyme family protein [Streptomyces sp. NPDC056773]|uniref:mandelate racemase/muconate lactonizing enzyme family protein n=1 Tax=unclassified Streptomyces TaxID=2593676 RepID=UPI0036745BE8